MYDHKHVNSLNTLVCCREWMDKLVTMFIDQGGVGGAQFIRGHAIWVRMQIKDGKLAGDDFWDQLRAVDEGLLDDDWDELFRRKEECLAWRRSREKETFIGDLQDMMTPAAPEPPPQRKRKAKVTGGRRKR